MDTVYDLIVVTHLVGMAAIIGGWLAQLGAARPHVPVAVVHGAALQLISGLALVGIASADLVDRNPDNAKIAVKLVIAMVVFVLAYLARQRGERVSPVMLHAVGGLALANVLIAVLW